MRRGTPDLSMDADPNTGVRVYDSYNGGLVTGVGGTSLSAPCLPAWSPTRDRNTLRRGQRHAWTDSRRPCRAATACRSSDFHDIILGSDAFPALAGYDLATGLGTPQANLLVTDLANFGVAVPEPSTLALLAAEPLPCLSMPGGESLRKMFFLCLS